MLLLQNLIFLSINFFYARQLILIHIRVLNFDVYCSVSVVRTSPRGYQYADHPLPSDTSVLTLYRYRAIQGMYRVVMVEIRPLPRCTGRYVLNFDNYRSVPVGTPQISIVTDVYRSVLLGNLDKASYAQRKNKKAKSQIS